MVLLMGALLRLRKQEILKNSLTLPVALSTLFYPKTFWAILRVLYCKQFFKILTILEMRTFMPEQRDLFLLPVHCHHWMFFSFNLHSASLHWEVRWIMRATWHRRLCGGGGGGQNPTKVMVLSRGNCYAPCCMPKKPDLNILNGDYNFDLLYYSYPLGSSIKVVNIRHRYTQFSSALSSGLWIIMYSIFHPIFFWHLCKINVYESLNYIIELNWVSICFIMTLSVADPVQLTSSIIFFGLPCFLWTPYLPSF